MAFAATAQRAPARRPRRRRFPFVRWTLLAAIVALGGFVAGLFLAPVDLAVPPPPQSTVLLDGSNTVFATIRSPTVREPVSEAQIPDVMRNAIVAAEDKRFLTHKGVDPLAVLRATVADLRAKSAEQGGSTITQQYVKNVYVGNEKTALRKIKEAALAVRLEQQKSKQEILTAYLNGVFFGNGVYGVQAASKYYFGKPASGLTLGEAAMLAGIVPAPSVRNPVRNFRAAREHQLNTLNSMAELGMIDPQQASDAFRAPPDIVQRRDPELPTEAPEFADLVRRDLDAHFSDTLGTKEAAEETLFSGLRVRTTLDLTLQQAVRAAVREVLPNPDDPDAAVAVIDFRNGDLKAVHSSGYTRGGFNYATQGRRSPGSVMKMFALPAALSKGITPEDTFPDPRCFRYGRGAKDVACNYEQTGGGRKTLERATWRSSNTVYLQVAKRIGTDTIRDQAVAMGAEGSIDLGATMVIGGGVGLTPLSVTRGMATLANGGVRQDVRTVLEVRRGDGVTTRLTGEAVLARPAQPGGRRVLSPEVAATATNVLKGVVTSGTARRAKQDDFEVFGKTGTASDNTDAWFVGCAPTEGLCVGVWLGHGDKLRPMRRVNGVAQVTGGSLPAEIFTRFWQKADELQAAKEALTEGDAPTPTASPRPRRKRTTPPATPGPVVRTTAPAVSRSPAPSATTEPSPEPEPEPTLTGGGPTGTPPVAPGAPQSGAPPDP